ncbi:MAG: hypothetical protein WD534_16115 [Phycisphaeraceae bacterium]
MTTRWMMIGLLVVTSTVAFQAVAKGVGTITFVDDTQADYDGVRFDNLYHGSIIVAVGARRQWRNVFFGDDNADEPSMLFRNLQLPRP